MRENILIKGAREHNLKNIDIEIPRNQLVVITGLSGSGKSSLAFDTIYAEGQRRYMESLSSYARLFLGQMEKPDVDYIEGLSPAISIDQKTTAFHGGYCNGNSRLPSAALRPGGASSLSPMRQAHYPANRGTNRRYVDGPSGADEIADPRSHGPGPQRGISEAF